MIGGIEQFGLVAETDIFNNIEISKCPRRNLAIVKSDMQRITSAGKMVERAKQGYVNVRKREFEIEQNQNMDQEAKNGMIDYMKDEKKWAYEGLAHEVNEFNEICGFSDDNFDQFLINKDEFHIQMEIRCKQAFVEIVDESKRLNDNIFEGMKETTERISKSVEELLVLTKRNQAERAQIIEGQEQPDDTEATEGEGGENPEKELGEEDAENLEAEMKENLPPLRRRVSNTPKITTEKIVEYIDNAIDSLKNGVQDDDANANEVSSLTSQFKFINNNMKQGIKSKLSNIFTKSGSSASDLKHFLIKVLQGAPVLDFQVEKVSPTPLTRHSFATASMRRA